MFKIQSNFLPKGDQPDAIKKIVNNFKKYNKHVLLGATGTGKTFTIANVISKLNKQTLVIVHNKTLAFQLYEEFKSLFPKNNVEYFVSLFDFYTPEAYVVKSDTYVDKNSKSNLEITLMRRRAQNALLSNNNTIVVASVAAIYGLDDPLSYKKNFLYIYQNQKLERKDLLNILVKLGYIRNESYFNPGYFSLKGESFKIYPGWSMEYYLRIDLFDDEVEKISKLDILNNNIIEVLDKIIIFPASNYIVDKLKINQVSLKIKKELKIRKDFFKKNNKLIEYQRINERVSQDIETISEFGYCSGMENYAAIIENRSKGVPPYTLLDYFNKDFITIIDESHITLPQIKGMYIADHKRKKNLVDYGFRLPSALDNRPLTFQEFIRKTKNSIYVSATPGDYELNQCKNSLVEQIIRPTGLLDPIIELRPATNQINDLVNEIKKRVKLNEKVFITTLTISMSEDLTSYLQEQGLKVTYLHNELKTLERSKIINDLRRGVYDAIVGINLLREGLDVPEVSLVAILDADKEGFLRDKRSLIQIIGRAARNKNGIVIMYSNNYTKSINSAIKDTSRRRKIQKEFNKKHNIEPKTIKKSIKEIKFLENITSKFNNILNIKGKNKILAKDELIKTLKKKMLEASSNLEFEKASNYRDILLEIDSMILVDIKSKKLK